MHDRNDLGHEEPGEFTDKKDKGKEAVDLVRGVDVEEELVAGKQMKPNKEPGTF